MLAPSAPCGSRHRTARNRRTFRLGTDQKLCALCDDFEEVPWAGDAFEFVFALVAEDEVGACQEVGDGARDEDLVGVGVGADALPDVDGDTRYVAVLELDLATVKTSTDLEPEWMNLVADRARAADGPGRAVEGGEDAVAG